MAIKGKSKPRARRAVTPGPKPAYVPVRKPLLARRGVQIGLAIVLAAGSIYGIWYGVQRERRKDAEAALAKRLRASVTGYQTALGPVLVGVGQQSGPSTFAVLPDLASSLDGLKGGVVSPADAELAGKAAEAGARTAWKAIDAIDVLDLVRNKGFNEVFVTYMLNSKARMVQGLKLYQQVAVMVREAAQAPEQERADLLAIAADILEVATQTFDDGFADLIQAQAKAGLI